MFEGISHIAVIWIFVGLGVMVILFLISSMARLYRKAGPHGRERRASRSGPTRKAGPHSRERRAICSGPSRKAALPCQRNCHHNRETHSARSPRESWA